MPVRRLKVIVVDDDLVALALAAESLRALGHEVIEKHGALGTAALVRRESPDLLLIDVEMPGLSGSGLLQTLQQVRGSSALPALYLLSGLERETLANLSTRLGADGYVCKSGGVAQLRSELARATARIPARPPASAARA